MKDLVKKAVKGQVEGINQPSYTYANLYSQRIDLIKMPINYQPLKFQQFEGEGNTRQHVAHFVEICNNAGQIIYSIIEGK